MSTSTTIPGIAMLAPKGSASEAATAISSPFRCVSTVTGYPNTRAAFTNWQFAFGPLYSDGQLCRVAPTTKRGRRALTPGPWRPVKEHSPGRGGRVSRPRLLETEGDPAMGESTITDPEVS